MKIKDIIFSNEYRTNIKQNYTKQNKKSMNKTKNFLSKNNIEFISKQINNNLKNDDINNNDSKFSIMNTKNSLNQFPLLQQIKTSWKFLSTLILDSFYEILSYINKDTTENDLQKISFFIQHIFKEHYKYTKNLLRTKIFNIMEYFGLSIKSESQVKAFTEKITPLFKFYFRNCFQWKNTDTENFITHLKKTIEYKDLLNKMIINNNNKNINTMFNVSYEICNFMILNDELLTYEIQTENYILKYEKEKMINIDGFIQKNDDCLLLLNTPMIRKKYAFYKLLPIVYFLNNNNSTITKSSHSTITKNIFNENNENINNTNEKTKITNEDLNSLSIFNKKKDSKSKNNKNLNNNKKKKSAKHSIKYRKRVRLLSPTLFSGHKTTLLSTRINKNISSSNFLLSQSNNNINAVPKSSSFNSEISLFNQSNRKTTKFVNKKSNSNVVFNLKNNNTNFLQVLFKKSNKNRNIVLTNSSYKTNLCASKSSKGTLNWNNNKKNETIQGKKLFHEVVSYQNLKSFLSKRYRLFNKSKKNLKTTNYNKNESKNLENSKNKVNNSIQTEYKDFKNFQSFKKG